MVFVDMVHGFRSVDGWRYDATKKRHRPRARDILFTLGVENPGVVLRVARWERLIAKIQWHLDIDSGSVKYVGKVQTAADHNLLFKAHASGGFKPAHRCALSLSLPM